MANNIVYRRKGMHPIIAFILGFVFGIIFLIGGVAIGVYAALNYKLDNIEANKDENGYKYVNAQEAETVLDLFMKISELASDSELTIGKIENLFPIAESFTDGIFESLNKYVPVDKSEIKNLTFSEFGTYLQEKVMDIRPAALLDSFGFDFGSGGSAELISLILNGKEAETVSNEGEVYPVYYEVYRAEGSQYVSESGVTLNPAEVKYLVEKDDYFVMYFCEAGANRYQIAERGEDGSLSYTAYGYSSFDGNKNSTGGYYYAADGTKIEIEPVTIRSFADGSAFNVLNELVIADFISSDDSGLTKKLLGNITVGDVLNGNVDFDEIINTLEVAEVIDIDPTNNIMVYMGLGVTDLFDDNGTYTGKYKFEDGTSVTCYLVTEPTSSGVKATAAYYVDENGNEVQIPATTVLDMNDRLQNITQELALSDLMVINTPTAENSNAIMIFLSYSVSGVEAAEGEDYDYTGVYYPADGEAVDCYLSARDGEVADVYYYSAEGVKTPVDKTSIAGVSSQVNRLTNTLKIKEIVPVDEDNKFMSKIGEYTINTVQNAVNELTIKDIMDVEGNKLLEMIGNSTIAELPEYVDSLAVNELYADSIYAPNATQEDYVANRYLAVTLSELHVAAEFNSDCVYYVRDDNGEYVLASTTGKLTGFDDGTTYYTCGEGKILFNSAYLYYVQVDDGFKMVAGGGSVSEDEFEENTFYTYGAANAMWQLLLYDNGRETAFSVNGLTAMISNVSANTKTANMYTLHEAGILTFDNPADLDKVILYNNTPTKIGNLELGQLVGYFVSNTPSLP